jgi:hypothetical protein
MKVNANLLVGTVAIVATGAILWRVFKTGRDVATAACDVFVNVKQAAADGLKAIDPTSPVNIFYRGANALTQAGTGNSVDSFGTWLAGLGDKSGAIATAPSNTAKLFDRREYEQTLAIDDMDAGRAVGFSDAAYNTSGSAGLRSFYNNGGGAATGVYMGK